MNLRLLMELRSHRAKSERRHPMYDTNRVFKIFNYVGLVLTALYLVFFGFMSEEMLGSILPNRNVYDIFNGYCLIFLLFIDFFFNLRLQPAQQEMRPYLLLPVKRIELINSMLLQNLLSPYKLLWFCFIIPFSVINIAPIFGFTGVFSYWLGILMLIVANGLWSLICRNLISYKKYTILIPLLIYISLGYGVLRVENSPIFIGFMYFGEWLIEFNLIAFASLLLLIFVLWKSGAKILTKITNIELAIETKQGNDKIRDFSFLDRYKDVGEYIKLEFKLLTRNSVPKQGLIGIPLMFVAFVFLGLYTDIYSGELSSLFLINYPMLLASISLLGGLMSYEGNYIELLYTGRLSLIKLIKVKYYFSVLVSFIFLLLLLPLLSREDITLYAIVSNFIFIIGFGFFLIMQLAVYNKSTMPLNTKITTNKGVGFKMTIVVFFAIATISSLVFAIDNWILHIIYVSCGVLFILLSPLWLKSIANRILKRKYKSIEGYINTRTRK
ncbi:MAG: DUF5687 family protein [Bacteroides sp.]|nr:DUF5687 family protein [Bacteroides sp.]